MLQRAAKNAYSWWWASHIRTKQSKWLDQNIRDMEEKVDYILKIIDGDGDSFARRAEMYYRKRLELLNFVEDTFRNYRALAERYDHLSRDLQTANRTIASVFPEKVQISMFDEDGEGFLTGGSAAPPEQWSNDMPAAPNLTIPKIVSMMKKKSDKPSKVMTKKGLLKFSADDDANFNANATAGSGLNKDEALLEIDNLQKQILAVQTEREFVKSSYEHQIGKYWEFENQVSEMQAKVNRLQDEFGIGTNIEDEEARSLMTCTALKSCRETLERLQQQQEQSNEAAKTESQKLHNAKLKFESIVKALTANQTIRHKVSVDLNEESKKLEQKLESSHLESSKIKEDSEFCTSTSFTVSELAEKVDDAVEKVIGLEISASSQNAYLNRLKTEADELLVQLNQVEEEKEALVKDSEDASKKIRELEEKLKRVMKLEQTINDQSSHLQTHFSDANSTLDGLSVKLKTVQPDEEVDDSSYSSCSDVDSQSEFQVHGNDEVEKQCGPYPISPKMADQNIELSDKRDTDAYDSTFRSPDVNLSDLSTKDPPSTINDNKNDFNSPPKGPKSDAHVNFADTTISAVLGGAETGMKQQRDDFPDQGTSLAKREHADSISDILGDEVTEEKLKKGSYPDQDTATAKREHTDSISGIGGDEVPREKFKKGGGHPDQENLQDPRTRKEGEETDTEYDQPNWRELFLNGLDEREKVLLEEYITALRNYKEAKMKHNEAEKKRRASHFQYVIQIKVLKSSIASKDAEIQSLKKKLNSAQENHVETRKSNENITKSSSLPTAEKKSLDEYMKSLLQLIDVPTSKDAPVREEAKHSEETSISNTKGDDDEVDVKIANLDEPQTFSTIDKVDVKIANLDEPRTFSTIDEVDVKIANLDKPQTFSTIDEVDVKITNLDEPQTFSTIDAVDVKIANLDEPQTFSTIEEKIRMDIDDLLEENIEFWLRFSTSLHQVKKFQTSVEDLQAELQKVREKNKQEGSSKPPSLLSDIRPIYKHMKEIKTELFLWLEHSSVLKEDLKHRLSSLTNIQDEVTKLSLAGTNKEEIQLTTYQATKFQGEILNMKHENNKVANELKSGSECVEKLQADVKTTLSKLEKELGIKSERGSNSKIPVTSFLFGMKLKKQMPTNILSRVSPAIMQKPTK
ncbi:PREDICTED: protein NETWORKED 2A-like isoform X2 [Ipomoea nil]|uniref:protein NETWORKED 2A-like isoform X2 n=1 Tax=Ipomoea nil TaxID=35883 RepID=UPI000901F4E0|nr:PREDICTED: protein NETWORKED 2A-like isoform X2 [Ipomoea nil]